MNSFVSGTAYQVVFLLLDPFVGSRVAIGSLYASDGVRFLRCELPDGVALSGAAAALAETACRRLEASTSKSTLADLGPCFSLSETRWTPCVDDVPKWLSSLVGSAAHRKAGAL